MSAYDLSLLPKRMLKRKIRHIGYVIFGLCVFLLTFKAFHYRQFEPYPFLPNQMSVNGLLTAENFKQIFEPAIIRNRNCSEGSQFLFAINSGSANFARREAIRETLSVWVKESNQTILFFISNPNDSNLLRRIKDESRLYRDIVMLPIEESYYLLAYKMLAVLNWATNNCSGIKFLIKCDDDMFVSWPKLYRFLESKNATDQIYGKLARLSRPIREWYSRWYISTADYPHEFFPDFTTGQLYIIGSNLLPKLLNAAGLVKPIYLEDVYLTGILRERIPEAKIVHIENLITLSLLKWAFCLPRSFYSIHQVTTSQMRYFFVNYSKETSRICSLLYVPF